MDFVPKTPYLTQPPPNFNPFIDGRIAGGPVDFYYSSPITVSGTTDDSQLSYVKSLRVGINGEPIYTANLNVSKDKYRFDGVLDDGAQRVKYKIGANVNNIMGTGVEYNTYKNKFVKGVNEIGEKITRKKTTLQSVNGGWNENNTSLGANIKQEELLGIVFPPEVIDDVFISRGIADIFERNAILSEIKTTNDLDNVRGGYLVSE